MRLTRLTIILPLSLILMMAVPFKAGAAALSINGCPSVYPLAFNLSVACVNGGGPHADVKPMVTSLAINGVQNGKIDIGMISRPLTAQEKATGLREVLLASEGLTLFVNRKNPVEGITKDEVSRIMRGEIRRWSALTSPGGADAPIAVVHHRSECGVTMAAKMRFLGDMKAKLVEGKEAMACPKVVAEVMNDPESIGYGPGAMTRGIGTIRVLKVDGVDPDREGIASGKYPYSFGLRLIHRQNPSPEVASFLKFINSEEGKRVIAEEGYELPDK